MLCGLDAAARADLARQVDAAYLAARSLTDRDRRRLTLCRVATVPPASTVESLPRDGESLRVAVARGRRHVQAVAAAGVRWMAEVAELGWVFLGVRELERHGGVTLAADDEYVLAVIGPFIDAGWWAGGQAARRYEPAARTSDRLRADPELLEKVFWRLFEVDRAQSPSLAGVDRLLSGPGATWREAVLDLIAAGAR
nr:hypothetical protein GCM10020063_020630 [Dactylosporangium thailandense]